MKRPWHIEYLNAESIWISLRSFHFRRNAERKLPAIMANQPAVMFRIEKHVSFEAAK